MYSFQTRVRYSECNNHHEATLTALLDYLQDCCTFQSEDLGIGLDFLTENHTAWILSSWQVDILRYPKLGEQLLISTWPYEMRDFFGLRNFKIEDAQGELILGADSVWVCVDTDSGKPMRPLPQMIEKYPPEPKLDMEYLGRKLPRLPQGEERTPIHVPHYFIDTNQHVNNAKYILIGEECLPENFKVHRIWAEYRRPAVLGDVICPHVSVEPSCTAVGLCNEDGAAYANLLFYEKAGARVSMQRTTE